MVPICWMMIRRSTVCRCVGTSSSIFKLNQVCIVERSQVMTHGFLSMIRKPNVSAVICDTIASWHHCYYHLVWSSNVILYCSMVTICNTITDANASASAKCDTIVHDNICGTKCNNNNWSYPGNGAKCISRLFVYQSSLSLHCVWKIHS